MPWNLKNVSLDPAFAARRRSAAKMDMEPVIAGTRIRLRQQVTISDELYEINKVRIAQCIAHGVLTAKESGAQGAAKPAPVAKPAPKPEPLPAPELSPTPAPFEPDEETPVEIPTPPRKKKSKKGSKS